MGRGNLVLGSKPLIPRCCKGFVPLPRTLPHPSPHFSESSQDVEGFCSPGCRAAPLCWFSPCSRTAPGEADPLHGSFWHWSFCRGAGCCRTPCPSLWEQPAPRLPLSAGPVAHPKPPRGAKASSGCQVLTLGLTLLVLMKVWANCSTRSAPPHAEPQPCDWGAGLHFLRRIFSCRPFLDFCPTVAKLLVQSKEILSEWGRRTQPPHREMLVLMTHLSGKDRAQPSTVME